MPRVKVPIARYAGKWCQGDGIRVGRHHVFSGVNLHTQIEPNWTIVLRAAILEITVMSQELRTKVRIE